MSACPNNLADATRYFRRLFLMRHLAAAKTITATATQLGTQRTYITRLNRQLDVEGPRSSKRPERT